jgi:hypothetical protein
MHPADLPAVDYSPITFGRLPAIIAAVRQLQADTESGDRPRVAAEAVVRMMGRLEGGEGLSANDPENAAIATTLPAATRRAVHFLFETLKHDSQAQWPAACAKLLDAVPRGDKQRPAYNRDHTFLLWKSEGMKPRQIAKRWNEEHPYEKVNVEVVETGTKKAAKETSQQG